MQPRGRLQASLTSVAHVPRRVRPAFSAGIRAALVIIVPQALGHLLDMPQIRWASIAGFDAVLADKGGGYPSRAWTMGTLGAAASIGAFVAGMAGTHAWLATPLMLVWAAGGSLGRVYGAGGASAGLSTSIIFLLSLSFPTSPAGALARGAVVLGGVLWAMLLALSLWPLRPNRPALKSIAHCFRTVGDLAMVLSKPPADEHNQEWQLHLHEERARIREALESARAALAQSRLQRDAESRRGERLLVLFVAADHLFAQLLALANVQEGAPLDDRAATTRLTRSLAATAYSIAQRVETLRSDVVGFEHEDLYSTWGSAKRVGLSNAEYERRAQAFKIAMQIGEYADAAVAAASALESPHPVRHPRSLPLPRAILSVRREFFRPVLDAMSRDSDVLRHSLRVGITTACGVLLSHYLRLSHGYWLTMTVLIILQPYQGATFVKAVQRIGGTVIGGLLAATVVSAAHDPRTIFVIVTLLVFVAVAVQPINYALYSALLTPVFVLLVEINEGSWNLAGARILNTLVGGALAYAGSQLLWPSLERERFPRQAAAAIQAARGYLDALARALSFPSSDSARAIAEARRRLGLAEGNAEASFQRLLTESAGGQARADVLQAAMTILIYTRRLGATLTTLAAAQVEPADVPGIVRLSEAASSVLNGIARGMATTTLPPQPPDLLAILQGVQETEPSPSRQLHRMVRQIGVLHAAVARSVVLRAAH